MANEIYVDINARLTGFEEAKSAMMSLVAEADKLDPSMDKTRDTIKNMATDFANLSTNDLFKTMTELPTIMQTTMNGFMHVIASSASTLKNTFSTIGKDVSAAMLQNIKNSTSFLSANVTNALMASGFMKNIRGNVPGASLASYNESINSMIRMASDIIKDVERNSKVSARSDQAYGSALSAHSGFKTGFQNIAKTFGLSQDQQKSLMHGIVSSVVPTYKRSDYLDLVERLTGGSVSANAKYVSPANFVQRLPQRFQSLPVVPKNLSAKQADDLIAKLGQEQLSPKEYNLVKSLVEKNPTFERALNMAGVQTRGSFSAGSGANRAYYSVGLPKNALTKDIIGLAMGYMHKDIANPIIEGPAVTYKTTGGKLVPAAAETLATMYREDLASRSSKDSKTLGDVVSAFRKLDSLGINPIYSKPRSGYRITPGRNNPYVGLRSSGVIMPDQYLIPALTYEDFIAGKLPNKDNPIINATRESFNNGDIATGSSVYKAISRSARTDLLGMTGHMSFGNGSKTNNSNPKLIQLDLSDRYFNYNPNGRKDASGRLIDLVWDKTGPQRNKDTEALLTQMLTNNSQLTYTHNGETKTYSFSKVMMGDEPYVPIGFKNGLMSLARFEDWKPAAIESLERTGKNVFDAYEDIGKSFTRIDKLNKALESTNRNSSPSVPLSELGTKLPGFSQIGVVNMNEILGKDIPLFDGSSMWMPGIMPSKALTLRGAGDAFKGTAGTVDFKAAIRKAYGQNTNEFYLPSAGAPEDIVKLWRRGGIEAIRKSFGDQAAQDYFVDAMQMSALIDQTMIKNSDAFTKISNNKSVPKTQAEIRNWLEQVWSQNGGPRVMQTSEGYLSRQNSLSETVMQHMHLTPKEIEENTRLWNDYIAELRTPEGAVNHLFQSETDPLHMAVRANPSLITTDPHARKIVDNAIMAAEISRSRQEGFGRGNLAMALAMPNPFSVILAAGKANGLKVQDEKLAKIMGMKTRRGEEDVIATMLPEFNGKDDASRLLAGLRYPNNFAEQFKLYSDQDYLDLIKEFGMDENSVYMNMRTIAKMGGGDFDGDTIQLMRESLAKAARRTFDANKDILNLKWDKAGNVNYPFKEIEPQAIMRPISTEDKVNLLFREAMSAFGLSGISKAVSNMAQENLEDPEVLKRYGDVGLRLKKMYDVDTTFIKNAINASHLWNEDTNKFKYAAYPFTALFKEIPSMLQNPDAAKLIDFSNYNFPSAFHARTVGVLKSLQESPFSSDFLQKLIESQTDGNPEYQKLINGSAYQRAHATFLDTNTRLVSQILTGRGQIVSAESQKELESNLSRWRSLATEARQNGEISKAEYDKEIGAIQKQENRINALKDIGVTEQRVALGQGYLGNKFGLAQAMKKTDAIDAFVQGLPDQDASRFMQIVLSGASRPIVEQMQKVAENRSPVKYAVRKYEAKQSEEEVKKMEEWDKQEEKLEQAKKERISKKKAEAEEERKEEAKQVKTPTEEIYESLNTLYDINTKYRPLKDAKDVIDSTAEAIKGFNTEDADGLKYTKSDIEKLGPEYDKLMDLAVKNKSEFAKAVSGNGWKTPEQVKEEARAVSLPKQIAKEIALQKDIDEYSKQIGKISSQLYGEVDKYQGKKGQELGKWGQYEYGIGEGYEKNIDRLKTKGANPGTDLAEITSKAEAAKKSFEEAITSAAIDDIKEGVDKIRETRKTPKDKIKEKYQQQVEAIDQIVKDQTEAFGIAKKQGMLTDDQIAEGQRRIKTLNRKASEEKYRAQVRKAIEMDEEESAMLYREEQLGEQFGYGYDKQASYNRNLMNKLHTMQADIFDRYKIYVRTDKERQNVIADTDLLRSKGLSDNEIRLLRTNENDLKAYQQWQDDMRKDSDNYQRDRRIRNYENQLAKQTQPRARFLNRPFAEYANSIQSIKDRMQYNTEARDRAEREAELLRNKPGGEANLSTDEKAKLEEQTRMAEEYNRYIEADKKSLEGLTSVGGMFGVVTGSVMDSLSRLTQMFSRRIFMKMANEVMQFAKQYDAAMTEIQMITLKSDQQMEQVSESNVNTALRLQTDVTSVASVKSGLYRQGLTDAEVESRTDQIIKFAKVAGIKTETASKIITTAIQNGLVDSAQEAIDVLAALGDSAATTADEIQKALQKTAATAANAGLSYEELTATLTVALAKTQLSGNVVGTAMSTIMTRMRRVNESDYVKSSTGEITTINDVDRALSRVGVSIRDENGKMKDTVSILKDLAAVWNDIESDVQKQNIVYAMAGRGSSATNTLYSILEGMGEDGGKQFKDALATATGAEGIVDEKYEKYLDSLNGKLAELKASFQGLVETLSVDGVTGGFLDLASGALQAMSNLGGVMTVVVSLTAALAAMAVQAKIAVAGTAALKAVASPLALLAGVGVLGAATAIGYIGTVKKNRQEVQASRNQAAIEAQNFVDNYNVNKAQDSVDVFEKISKKYKSLNEEFKSSADYGDFTASLNDLGKLFGTQFVSDVQAACEEVDGFAKALDMVKQKINDLKEVKTFKQALSEAYVSGDLYFGNAKRNKAIGYTPTYVESYLSDSFLDIMNTVLSGMNQSVRTNGDTAKYSLLDSNEKEIGSARSMSLRIGYSAYDSAKSLMKDLIKDSRGSQMTDEAFDEYWSTVELMFDEEVKRRFGALPTDNTDAAIKDLAIKTIWENAMDTVKNIITSVNQDLNIDEAMSSFSEFGTSMGWAIDPSKIRVADILQWYDNYINSVEEIAKTDYQVYDLNGKLIEGLTIPNESTFEDAERIIYNYFSDQETVIRNFWAERDAFIEAEGAYREALKEEEKASKDYSATADKKAEASKALSSIERALSVNETNVGLANYYNQQMQEIQATLDQTKEPELEDFVGEVKAKISSSISDRLASVAEEYNNVISELQELDEGDVALFKKQLGISEGEEVNIDEIQSVIDDLKSVRNANIEKIVSAKYSTYRNEDLNKKLVRTAIDKETKISLVSPYFDIIADLYGADNLATAFSNLGLQNNGVFAGFNNDQIQNMLSLFAQNFVNGDEGYRRKFVEDFINDIDLGLDTKSATEIRNQFVDEFLSSERAPVSEAEAKLLDEYKSAFRATIEPSAPGLNKIQSYENIVQTFTRYKDLQDQANKLGEQKAELEQYAANIDEYALTDPEYVEKLNEYNRSLTEYSSSVSEMEGMLTYFGVQLLSLDLLSEDDVNELMSNLSEAQTSFNEIDVNKSSSELSTAASNVQNAKDQLTAIENSMLPYFKLFNVQYDESVDFFDNLVRLAGIVADFADAQADIAKEIDVSQMVKQNGKLVFRNIFSDMAAGYNPSSKEAGYKSQWATIYSIARSSADVKSFEGSMNNYEDFFQGMLESIGGNASDLETWRNLLGANFNLQDIVNYAWQNLTGSSAKSPVEYRRQLETSAKSIWSDKARLNRIKNGAYDDSDIEFINNLIGESYKVEEYAADKEAIDKYADAIWTYNLRAALQPYVTSLQELSYSSTSGYNDWFNTRGKVSRDYSDYLSRYGSEDEKALFESLKNAGGEVIIGENGQLYVAPVENFEDLINANSGFNPWATSSYRTPGQITGYASRVFSLMRAGGNSNVYLNSLPESVQEQIKNTYGDLATYSTMTEAQRGSITGKNLEARINIDFAVSGLDELEEAGTIVSGLTNDIKVLLGNDKVASAKQMQSMFEGMDEFNKGILAYNKAMSSGGGTLSQEEWNYIGKTFGISDMAQYQKGQLSLSGLSGQRNNIISQNENNVLYTYGSLLQSNLALANNYREAAALRGFVFDENQEKFVYNPEAVSNNLNLDTYDNALAYARADLLMRNAVAGNGDTASLIRSMYYGANNAKTYEDFYNGLNANGQYQLGQMIDNGALMQFAQLDENGKTVSYDMDKLRAYLYSQAFSKARGSYTLQGTEADRLQTYMRAIIDGDAETFAKMYDETDSVDLESAIQNYYGDAYAEAARKLLTGQSLTSEEIRAMTTNAETVSLSERLKYNAYSSDIVNGYTALTSERASDVRAYLQSQRTSMEQGQVARWAAGRFAGGDMSSVVLNALTSYLGITEKQLLAMNPSDVSQMVDEVSSEFSNVIQEIMHQRLLEITGTDFDFGKYVSFDDALAGLDVLGAEVDDWVKQLLKIFYGIEASTSGYDTFAEQYTKATESSKANRENLLAVYNAISSGDKSQIAAIVGNNEADWSSFIQSNPALAWAMTQYSQEGYNGNITQDMLMNWANQAVFGGSSHEIDREMLNTLFPGLLEGNLSQEELGSMFLGAQTGENAEWFNYLLSAYPELNDIMQSLTSTTTDTSTAIESLNDKLSDQEVMSKVGKNYNAVKSSMDAIRNGAASTVKEAGALSNEFNRLGRANDKLGQALGKTGKQLDDETLDIISGFTGISKENLQKMGEEEIGEWIKGAQKAANEDWDLNFDKLMSDIMTDINAAASGEKGIDIQRAVTVSINAAMADGTVDTSELDGILAAADSALRGSLNAYAGTGASVVATIFSLLNGAGFKWGSVQGTKGTSGAKTGGGGGGGGKSAIEKLIAKLKNEMAAYEHYIKMIQYQETRYENANELTNYGKMIMMENEAQGDYINSMLNAIDQLKSKISTLKPESDDWYAARDAIMGYEEAIEEATETIKQNERKLRDIQNAIHKTVTDLEDLIRDEATNRENIRRDMLQGTVDTEDMILSAIRDRYQDEWDLIKQDIDNKRQALEEEKNLISERLNARKEAEDEAAKYEQLAEYQKQLAMVSMDSTRTKDAIELRKKISDLEKELAWDLAEAEAEAQQEAIDDQIQAYDEFTQVGDERLQAFLEDANNFTDEVDKVLQMSFEDMMAWLQANIEEYQLTLDAQQESMVLGWKDTFEQMHHITETYATLIDDVLSGGEEAFLKYMKESDEYINASEDMRAQLVDEWKKMYEDYVAAMKNDALYKHDDDFASGGSSSSGSSGGSGGNTSSTTSPTTQSDAESATGALDKAKETISNAWNAVTQKVKETVNNSNLSGILEGITNLFRPKYKFANGGLADYTGLAWVDGTKSRPEGFLDATDTALLRSFLDAAKYVSVRMPSFMYDPTFGGSGQTIKEVNITINEATINNDDDIEALAQKIGESFTRELSINGFSTSNYNF